jgi:hypothetical protein
MRYIHIKIIKVIYSKLIYCRGQLHKAWPRLLKIGCPSCLFLRSGFEPCSCQSSSTVVTPMWSVTSSHTQPPPSWALLPATFLALKLHGSILLSRQSILYCPSFPELWQLFNQSWKSCSKTGGNLCGRQPHKARPRLLRIGDSSLYWNNVLNNMY